MTKARIDIAEEAVGKKTFVWAIDWPGWCRSGKDRDLAIDVAARPRRPRTRRSPKTAGLDFPDVDDADAQHGRVGRGRRRHRIRRPVERSPSPTDRRSRRPRPSAWPSLVEAAWTVFDRVAARRQPTLRKGPARRRPRPRQVVGHVIEADHAYAREIGLRSKPPSADDRAAVEAERDAVLEVLRQPSDGSPLADRRWTAPLRGPPDRLARPRPRLGDRGPHRARGQPVRVTSQPRCDAARRHRSETVVRRRRNASQPRAAADIGA